MERPDDIDEEIYSMFDLIKVINKFEILFSALYLRTEL
jgi:hypothetical protein